MTQLKLENLTKTYGGHRPAADQINLEVTKGEFIVFVGPSGCGKSTVLRMIAGLEAVSSGRILLDDRDITTAPAGARQIAMVFQSYALYPHMSVEKNMGFSLKMAGTPKEEIRGKVTEVAGILQLESLLNRKPGELSGGQRQRVAIGRAIVRNPRLFLFDEPLSNLDAELRVEMRLQLTRLHQRLNTTMIYVTHDQVEAMTMADRIVVLKDGKIEQIGTPMALYHRPANRFVAGFIGSPKMNFIDVRLEDRDNRQTTVRLPCGSTMALPRVPRTGFDSDSAVLGIRPCDIEIRQTAPTCTLKTDVIEHLGARSLVHGSYAGQTLVVETRDPQDRANGTPLYFPPDKCHLFSRDGLSFKGRET